MVFKEDIDVNCSEKNSPLLDQLHMMFYYTIRI